MKRWGYFLGALVVSPLVLPVFATFCGLWSLERVLAARHQEHQTREAMKLYEELRAQHEPDPPPMVYRPTCWERLLDDA